MTNPSLPPAALLQQQAEWLAPARSRLLRRAHIARCRRVLDLGCGSGAVTGELARRAGGPVVALDRDHAALAWHSSQDAKQGATGVSLVPQAKQHGQDARGTRYTDLSAPEGDSPIFAAQKSGQSPVPVQADAARLPFASQSFDLVFCQFTLMWVDAPAAIVEIHRVLAPGGQLIALEPDYEAMIEHPAQIATRELWLAALARAGAEASMGRKLPGMLTAAGLSVRVDLLDRLVPPSPARFELLRGLPLTPAEQDALAAAEAADARLAAAEAPLHASLRVAHLPVFLVTAVKEM